MHRGSSLSLALFLIILPGVIAPLGAFGEKGVDAVLSSSRFPARDRERISEVFAAAHAEGIAEEMLRSRLEEGIAKRVAAPLLLSALRRDVSFLQSARATLLEVAGGAALLLDNASWSRAADLLSWGASPDNLARLAHSGASRPELFKATTYLLRFSSSGGSNRKYPLSSARRSRHLRLTSTAIRESSTFSFVVGGCLCRQGP